jgi:hypothetical protein
LLKHSLSYTDDRVLVPVITQKKAGSFFKSSASADAGAAFFKPAATTDNTIQRKCADCAAEEKETVQRSPITPVQQSGVLQKQQAPPETPATLPLIPWFEEEADTPATRAATERYRQRTAQAIEALRDAAARRDGTALTARMRSIPNDIVIMVFDSPDFMDLVLHRLNPVSGWILYHNLLMRIYPATLPADLMRQLTNAISSRNAGNAFRLLRILIPALTGFGVLPVLHNIIHRAFQSDPQHDAMISAISASEAERSRIPMNSVMEERREVHFDRPNGAAAGTDRLMQFTSYENYNWYLHNGEMRVVLIIKLVDADHPLQPYYLPEDRLQQWVDGINAAWNNLYRVTNTINSYRVVFAPAFVYNHNRPNHTVHIGHGNLTSQCNFLQRENQHCWYANTTGTTVAHEFGHMLGNSDEYRLPAHASDIPAAMQANMTLGEIDATTADGVPGTHADPNGGFTSDGLMGNNVRGSVALPRHMHPVLNQLNRSIISTPQPLYHVERL